MHSTWNLRPGTWNSRLRSPLRRPGPARALLGRRLGGGLRPLGLARLLAALALGLLLADRLDPAARGATRLVGERLLARRAVLRLELEVHELQDGRLGGVALAGAEPQDPRVAARTVDEPRRDRVEHALDRRA